MLEVLLNYNYPGNVRELENIIEHAFVLCRGEVVELRHLPMYLQKISGQLEADPISRQGASESRDQWERARIEEVLKRHQWHRQKTAKELDMDRTTLWRKMKRYNISP